MTQKQVCKFDSSVRNEKQIRVPLDFIEQDTLLLICDVSNGKRELLVGESVITMRGAWCAVAYVRGRWTDIAYEVRNPLETLEYAWSLP